jgi:hypothetical protein
MLKLPPVTAGAGAEPFRYDEKSDFTGGLNLRADQFNLEYNESPALLNVEVDPRGGVRRRDAVTKINGTALSNNIISLMTHYESGQNQVLAATLDDAITKSQIFYNDNATGDFTGPIQIGSDNPFFNTAQPPHSVTFNGFTYIVNGELLHNDAGVTAITAMRWDGATATALTGDIDGTDGHFPCARYTTSWNEHVWVAYTLESGTTHKNRLRWSKTSDAENWTATDFVDIDIGEDGDYITGILADQNRLLVFKENSVYEVLGFNTNNFQVRNVSRTAGNMEGCTPISTTVGVFFWYAEDGLYLLRDQTLAWAFERIRPSMTYDVGQPALTTTVAPSMMWFDERLWLSVNYQSDDNISGSNQTNRRNVFVWDASLGSTGAWVRHDINARSLLAYRPTNNTHLGIAATSGITAAVSFDRISKIDQNADQDDYGTGAADEINSYYQTGWFDGNRPTFSKRWNKTRTVLLADSNVTITQEVYKDYDLSGFFKSFSGSVVGLGSDSVWDTAKWDDSDSSSDYLAKWQAEGTSDRYLIVKWPTVGTATAISLRFRVTPTVSYRGKWGVTSIIGMYRTRRLR